MIEIKFRAWDLKENRWLTPYEVRPNIREEDVDGSMSISFWRTGIPVLPSNPPRILLERWTGLRDKNGKEIYEGDIWKWETETGVVEWFPTRSSFWLKVNDGYSKQADYFPLGEVIGNIHDNPRSW